MIVKESSENDYKVEPRVNSIE